MYLIKDMNYHNSYVVDRMSGVSRWLRSYLQKEMMIRVYKSDLLIRFNMGVNNNCNSFSFQPRHLVRDGRCSDGSAVAIQPYLEFDFLQGRKLLSSRTGLQESSLERGEIDEGK
jgi:hypothetical protein